MLPAEHASSRIRHSASMLQCPGASVPKPDAYVTFLDGNPGLPYSCLRVCLQYAKHWQRTPGATRQCVAVLLQPLGKGQLLCMILCPVVPVMKVCISAADPEKRKVYDAYGEEGLKAGAPPQVSTLCLCPAPAYCTNRHTAAALPCRCSSSFPENCVISLAEQLWMACCREPAGLRKHLLLLPVFSSLWKQAPLDCSFCRGAGRAGPLAVQSWVHADASAV